MVRLRSSMTQVLIQGLSIALMGMVAVPYCAADPSDSRALEILVPQKDVGSQGRGGPIFEISCICMLLELVPEILNQLGDLWHPFSHNTVSHLRNDGNIVHADFVQVLDAAQFI